MWLAAVGTLIPNTVFNLHLTVWGVEPVVTHQTSWLESTLRQVDLDDNDVRM